jgi:hypothetical protein
LGEVVRGRLADHNHGGKCHYWLVDLPKGSYKFVLDVRRADDRISNVGGRLSWFDLDGVRLKNSHIVENLHSMHLNEIDERARRTFLFNLHAPLKALVRYENSFTVSDYWLGLFTASQAVGAVFFDHAPAVNALSLGNAATASVAGHTAEHRDAYYSMHLEAGDYKVITEFRRKDGVTGNVGGTVHVLDPDGNPQVGTLTHVNEIDTAGRGASKLCLADAQDVVFRVRAAFTDEVCSFRVAKW